MCTRIPNIVVHVTVFSKGCTSYYVVVVNVDACALAVMTSIFFEPPLLAPILFRPVGNFHRK